MAESPRKRFREEEEEEETVEGEEETKRQCSFNHILSVMESEEEEPTQDLSSLITTLQQELSSPLHPPSESLSHPTQTQTEASSSPAPPSSTTLFKEHDEEEEEEVMRRLLEGSDGDLGVPQAQEDNEVGEAVSAEILTYDGIWELEDAAANYYTWLQSELFM